VVAIETLEDHPFVGGQAVKVSIFLSVFDVHVNRVPTAGAIDFVRYNPGKFFAAFEDKASDLNEQTEIGMTASSGHKVVFKQIAGLIARRIICHLKEGDSVSTGDRFGMIRYGSRADLIAPAGTEIKVMIGDHVAAGESVLGYLPMTAQPFSQENNAQGNGIEI
jgi:phosphatidylserine decarboxylase